MTQPPNMPNMKDIMQKAQEMQKKMQWTQQKLASMEVRGEAGAGLIIVIMSGRHEVKKVTIDPSVLKESKQILEELLASAINDATRKIEELLKMEMTKLTRDLGIPTEAEGGTGTAGGGTGGTTGGAVA